MPIYYTSRSCRFYFPIKQSRLFFLNTVKFRRRQNALYIICNCTGIGYGAISSRCSNASHGPSNFGTSTTERCQTNRELLWSQRLGDIYNCPLILTFKCFYLVRQIKIIVHLKICFIWQVQRISRDIQGQLWIPRLNLI